MAQDTARLFVDEYGRLLADDRFAEALRADLLAADIKRAELHEEGKNRRRIRAHDLRGTFATLPLPHQRRDWDLRASAGCPAIAQKIARPAGFASVGQSTDRADLLAADPPRSARSSESCRAREATEGRRSAPGRIRTCDQWIRKTGAEGFDQAGSGNTGHAADEEGREETDIGQSLGKRDPIQEALSMALRLAVERGDLGAITAVVNELRCRREALAGAVDLQAERRRRRKQ